MSFLFLPESGQDLDEERGQGLLDQETQHHRQSGSRFEILKGDNHTRANIAHPDAESEGGDPIMIVPQGARRTQAEQQSQGGLDEE